VQGEERDRLLSRQCCRDGGLMELKKMTAQAVMEVMDVQQPNWEMRWADQQDLIEALDLPADRRKEFLQSRVTSRIMLVLRAAYQLTKENA